jgi:hypothetical protein
VDEDFMSIYVHSEKPISAIQRYRLSHKPLVMDRLLKKMGPAKHGDGASNEPVLQQNETTSQSYGKSSWLATSIKYTHTYI